MTLEKSDRLRSIISQLDVCDKGKAKVTELIEELLGDKLVAEFKPKVGDVVVGDGISYVVVLKTHATYSSNGKSYFLGGYGGGVEPYSTGPFTYLDLLAYFKDRHPRIVGRVEQILFSPTK